MDYQDKERVEQEEKTQKPNTGVDVKLPTDVKNHCDDSDFDNVN